VGATEDIFAQLARADGIVFSRGVSPPWLTNRGHLSGAMADHLDAAREAGCRSIYLALGGDETLLVGKRSGSDPRLDFVLTEHALAVEVDEIQHFTSGRLRTLELYPPTVDVCALTPAHTASSSASGAPLVTVIGRRSRPSTSHSLAGGAPSGRTSTASAI
jgi:hypothetical protein